MSDNEAAEKESLYPCPECHAGHIRMRHVVYYTWVSGELITVPDFPAWVCDLCGMREYDQRALAWLKIILNPETGRKSSSRKAPPAPPKSPPLQPEV